MHDTGRLIVVRHGDTFAPGDRVVRIGRRTDLPLVATGWVQATTLGNALRARGVRPRRILCGPLRRAIETAALLAERLTLDVPVEVADWLAEIDHGPDEGRSEAEIVARIGVDALARWETAAVPPPGWTVDAQPRIAAFAALLEGLAIEGGDIVAVTSNGVARFALGAARSSSPGQAALPTMKLRTGAYGVLAAGPAGVRLEDWDERP